MNKSNLIFIGQSLSVEEFKKRFNAGTVHIIKNPKTNKVFFKAGSINGVVSKNINLKKDKTNLVFSLVKVENEDREFWLLHKKSKSDLGKVKSVTEKPTYSVKNNVATQNKIKKLNVQDKTKFITDILDYSVKKRADDKTKERLINLIGKEIEKTGNVEIEVIDRLKKIEDLLIDKPPIKNHKQERNIQNKNGLKYIPSENIYKFLYEYNQNPVLKYTCHEIDDEDIISRINKKCNTDEYNFKKHQELISETFDKLVKNHTLSKSVYALIKTYIDGGDGKEWSSNIKINWKSSEIIKWSKQNPGIPPNIGTNLRNKFQNNGFEIKAFKSSLTGNRIRNFSELILHFKFLFHIKADNPLKKILNRQNENKKWNEIIEFNFDNFQDNIELFTDVDKLTQVYRRFIEMILDVSEEDKPQVRLSFEEEGQNVLFRIHHTNSVFKKTINSTIERLGEFFTKVIENQINGLCDFYLQADFGNNQFAEVNIWNGKERKSTKIDSFKGVMYILEFKRK